MENKLNKRNGDEQKSHFRSGRFYSVADEWYFCVRENKDQGPYPNKTLAEESLKTYLMDFEHFNVKKLSDLKLN